MRLVFLTTLYYMHESDFYHLTVRHNVVWAPIGTLDDQILCSRELGHGRVQHHCSSKLEVGAVDDVVEAFADVEVYDGATEDVSCVVQCQLDVWSYVSHNIVPQWNRVRHDLSDVFLVEGGVFHFSIVTVEVVELG